MLVASMIGLGVASMAYSAYRQNKSDKQIDEANEINRNSAELSYKSQLETNALNYQIFKENQEYNSPSNLVRMYDELGLNGRAIVANQGFTPTAAPNMVAPQMQQSNILPYDNTIAKNGADAMMKSLLDAFSTEKVKTEIKELNSRIVYQEAQTESCKQSTKNLVQDYLLKDIQIELGDMDVILKSNEVDTINLKNAELRASLDMMNQQLSQNKQIHEKVLRQYDDKHALDEAEHLARKYRLDYMQDELKASLKMLYVNIRNGIKQGNLLDIEAQAQDIALNIARATQYDEQYKKHQEANEAKNRADKSKSEADISSFEAARKQNSYDFLNPTEDNSNAVTWHLRQLGNAFVIVTDGILSPLRGLISIGH